jgi:hypothetical protein
LNKNHTFALFYISIISICLFGSLVSKNLYSSKNTVPNKSIDEQSVLSATTTETCKQVVNVSTSANYTWMNFTFTWGPDTQKIVSGDFHLNVYMRWGSVTIGTETTETLKIIIEANDDDYEDWDYIGIVLDTSQNGYIDSNDDSILLFANEMHKLSILCDDGFLAFGECMPLQGSHNVLFDAETGYTFSLQFPPRVSCVSSPIQSIKDAPYSPIHV